jgi:hypothetical protein
MGDIELHELYHHSNNSFFKNMQDNLENIQK